MPKTKKKKIIKWLLLFLVLVLVGTVFYWQDVKKIFSPLSEEIWKKDNGNENQGKEIISPSPTSTEAQKTPNTINNFIDYVSKNISSLSPQPPVLGGRWGVNRFWFIKESIAYVEYEDGHILRQILVESKEADGGKIDYKVIGYFEPGSDEWILKEGDDPYFGKTGDLYEWDDINKNWKKR